MTLFSFSRPKLANITELLGSMRFAVSLLMFICVASLIGTVLQQNESASTYLDRFGPFWFELFDHFSIWNVYNSWWFLVIMAFLVTSTSLCLIRNTPKFIKDARSFREYVRGSSLKAFPHKVEGTNSKKPAQLLEETQNLLKNMGYRYKLRQEGEDVLLAAKKGGVNRLGFIFTHAAIVIICIGGLLDSELPMRLQVWLGGKQPITENMMISDVPDAGRMGMANPSFRAHMLVSEGGRSANAIINYGEGVFVQPLPFSIELKKFLVDYYSTGMPSSFKSEVIITDNDTGESFERLIEVNEPLSHKGVTVYQSSLDDGGSKVELQGYPLTGPVNKTFSLNGTVGKSSELLMGAGREKRLELDLTELRIINVENLAGDLEPQPKPLVEHVAAVTGSAAGRKNDKLTNVGPSVHYRLTDDAGQSSEFVNYMLPMTLDGRKVFLVGVRPNASQPFRYLRIPADANSSVQEFMDLRAALANPDLVHKAAQRFAEVNAGGDLQAPLLTKAAQGALESFYRSGFDGIINNVPESEREKVLEFAVPMIQFTLAELRDVVREETGQEPVPSFGAPATQAQEWLQDALLAFANLPSYPAPVFLSLKNFDHIQASVFQVTRSPGKLTVYLGSLFLVIGVFTMFYIRDRRVWVWIRPAENGSHALAAMTSMRRNLDFTQEFNRFKQAFTRLIT